MKNKNIEHFCLSQIDWNLITLKSNFLENWLFLFPPMITQTEINPTILSNQAIDWYIHFF